MYKRRWILILLVFFTIFLTACSGSGTEPLNEEDIADQEGPSDAIEPVYLYWDCENDRVPSGNEIAVYFEWVTQTEEQNEDFFNASQFDITINGAPASIDADGFNGIEKTEDGYFKQTYWMNIGKLYPGDFEIKTTITINESVTDGWDTFGPDSDHPDLTGWCSIVVEEQTDELADEDEIESQPLSETCGISNSIHEDWTTTVCETFDTDTILWTGTDSGTSARVENGQYILDNSTKVAQGYTTGFIYPVTVGEAQDYMISVDGSVDSMYKSIAWGVFVRSTQSEIVYFFMVDNEGYFMLTGSSDQESKRYLGNIKDGSSSAIVWDGTNNITAVVDGSTMEFYVNGELMTTHEAIDDVSPSFGLIVWGGEGVTAINQFDNLLVRTKY